MAQRTAVRHTDYVKDMSLLSDIKNSQDDETQDEEYELEINKNVSNIKVLLRFKMTVNIIAHL